jgi:hypothetical protein
MGGAAFYPYQIALGMSLRYWPCLFAPSIRVHIGPFKLWGAVSFCAFAEERKEDAIPNS